MYLPFSLHFLLLFMCLTGVRDAESNEYSAETDASESEVGYDNNYLKKFLRTLYAKFVNL